jgi:hypothetical protein
MELTQETLSPIIQAAGMIRPSFKIGIHEHTPQDLIQKARQTYFTDWFVQAYVLLNDEFLSLEDNRDGNTYKVTLKNIENGLKILSENYHDSYKSLSEKHYYPKNADALLQCAIFGEVKCQWKN